jgi:hypothetical protein
VLYSSFSCPSCVESRWLRIVAYQIKCSAWDDHTDLYIDYLVFGLHNTIFMQVITQEDFVGTRDNVYNSTIFNRFMHCIDYTLWFGRWLPMFWRNILPPSLVPKLVPHQPEVTYLFVISFICKLSNFSGMPVASGGVLRCLVCFILYYINAIILYLFV